MLKDAGVLQGHHLGPGYERKGVRGRENVADVGRRTVEGFIVQAVLGRRQKPPQNLIENAGDQEILAVDEVDGRAASARRRVEVLEMGSELLVADLSHKGLPWRVRRLSQRPYAFGGADHPGILRNITWNAKIATPTVMALSAMLKAGQCRSPM